MTEDNHRTIQWVTTDYPTQCEECGITVPKRKRMLHVEIAGNHRYYCRICAADPYAE